MTSTGIEYALVSDNNEQIHQFVRCKDFLHDVIHGYVNAQYTSIYGFKYDPLNSPLLSRKRTKLIVTHAKDSEFGMRLKNHALPLLHQVETALKMSRTKIEMCANIPKFYKRSGIWLLDSSKRWSSAPPMISLFSLLIRIGLVCDSGMSLNSLLLELATGKRKGYYGTIVAHRSDETDEEQDQSQVLQAYDGIMRIMKYGDRKLFGTNILKNYPPITTDQVSLDPNIVDMFVIHDHCGISSFSKFKNKEIFPHWYKSGLQENR